MKYSKKPVVIEAFRLGIDDMPEWFKLQVELGSVNIHTIPLDDSRSKDCGKTFCEIHTLEGVMLAQEGKDYIIKGVDGELYPCKIDIFEKTYEKIEEDNTQ